MAHRQPLPKYFLLFTQLAVDAHLSHPTGRAWYACNRAANEATRHTHLVYREEFPLFPDPIRNVALLRMLRCRPETARRWQRHMHRGGSVKSLQRTYLEELARRRADYAAHREAHRRWRKIAKQLKQGRVVVQS